MSPFILFWGEHSKRSGTTVGLQGRLAQLEECLVCNQDVVGSNPTTSTTLVKESEPRKVWTHKVAGINTKMNRTD